MLEFDNLCVEFVFSGNNKQNHEGVPKERFYFGKIPDMECTAMTQGISGSVLRGNAAFGTPSFGERRGTVKNRKSQNFYDCVPLIWRRNGDYYGKHGYGKSASGM